MEQRKIKIKMAEIINDAELNGVAGGAGTVQAFVYTVQKGDCLSVLAQRYHTTVSAIMALNCNYSATRTYYIQNPDRIYIGQQILIPKTF